MKEWLDKSDWFRLLGIFIAVVVSDTILAVTLLGYSRSTSNIAWSLGFQKLGDLIGDVGNLLIIVAVIAAVTILAVLIIEDVISKAARYIVLAISVIVVFVWHDAIWGALTGISGVAVIGITLFVFGQSIVMFFITKPRKEVAQ